MSNKYEKLIEYKEFLPNRFLKNIKKFELIKQIEFKEILLKYNKNNNFTKKKEENILYYDIILYLLKEWSQYNNIFIDDINNIFNNFNYSNIDKFIDNKLYKYCIKLKKGINNIFRSETIDIYYKYFKNYIVLSFVIKYKDYIKEKNISLIKLYIPHKKEYNPNDIIIDHVIYIMNYSTDNYINNFFNKCILFDDDNSNISNEHLTILKNTKGFHYSRNSNIERYIFFDNIDSIIDIYIQLEIYNNMEFLYSILNKNELYLIDNRELLIYIMKFANRYFIIKNNYNMNFDIPGIFEKDEIDIFYKKMNNLLK